MRNKSKRKQLPVEAQTGADARADKDAQMEAEIAEAKRKREHWERVHANDARELEESRRVLFTAFKLWTVCPHKVCARAKACRGDVLECMRVRWRKYVSDDTRALLSKTITLWKQGMEWPEALKAATADIAQCRAVLAKYEARRAEWDSAPLPAAQQPAADLPAPVIHGPRVRRLD